MAYLTHEEVILRVIGGALAGPPHSAALSIVRGLDEAGYLKRGRATQESFAEIAVSPVLQQVECRTAADHDLAARAIATQLDNSGYLRPQGKTRRKGLVGESGGDDFPW